MNKVLKNFVGIDISKATFDVAIFYHQSVKEPNLKLVHSQFHQNVDGFRSLIAWLEKQNVFLNEETLFCMEDTGLYSRKLSRFLVANNAQLWIEMPLRIKRSDDFSRGNNDKTDAEKIARYAFRYQDRMQLWQPVDDVLHALKHWEAQRIRLKTSINQLQVPINEVAECDDEELAKELEKSQRSVIKELQKSIEVIEARIQALIEQDEQLSLQAKRIESITGIGKVTATNLIVYTKGFTAFKNAKQLACYVGVVPFIGKESGSSIRSKSKVSPYANKTLKWLFHMCATTAIQHDAELKAYYQRKISEGKNKMSVINAVRNKMVSRVFAVVRDERMFVKNWEPKCA